jgi:hypothetical protein
MFPLERDEELTVKANSAAAGVYMTAGCQKELGGWIFRSRKRKSRYCCCSCCSWKTIRSSQELRLGVAAEKHTKTNLCLLEFLFLLAHIIASISCSRKNSLKSPGTDGRLFFYSVGAAASIVVYSRHTVAKRSL